MTVSHAISGIQGLLRSQVETCRSLPSLYDRLRRIASGLSVQRAEELRADAETAAFRAQLGEILPRVRGPFMDLTFRAELCAAIDHCEDEDEVYHLCFAIISHIGGEVEMYSRAVDVDPDQRRYRGIALGEDVPGARQRPRLVSIDGGAAESGDPPANRPRTGRRAPGR